MAGEFVADITAIQQDARRNMNQGCVTMTYGGDPTAIINVLQTALATELVCILRYQRHIWTAKGQYGPAAVAIFQDALREEETHRDKIAKRICELGGAPDFNPATLTQRSNAPYNDSSDLMDMLREDLVAERIAISIYTEILHWLGGQDSYTAGVISDLLHDEEDHASHLAALLADGLPGEPTTGAPMTGKSVEGSVSGD